MAAIAIVIGLVINAQTLLAPADIAEPTDDAAEDILDPIVASVPPPTVAPDVAAAY
tara:strand:+ start:295 stop:462 length:168 start_codon:yes stop_codon:yes gene_type:complete